MGRLRSFQCPVFGFFDAAERRRARKYMSGLVESAIYRMYPSSSWYCIVCSGVLVSDSVSPCSLTPSLYGVGFPLQGAMSAFCTI